jgi:molybdopterin converting factor small subunit
MIFRHRAKMPSEEAMDGLAQAVSQNLVAKLFDESYPDLHKVFNRLLGTLREAAGNDQDVVNCIDNKQISNEDVVNIFMNHIIPEYEKLTAEDNEDFVISEEAEQEPIAVPETLQEQGQEE